MMTSASRIAASNVVFQRHARGDPGQFARQQRRRTAKHDVGAELREQMDVRAGDAAVSDVADDRNAQAIEPAAVIENRPRVEQRLCRMLMRAVAGVHDRSRAGAARENAARRTPNGA